MTDKKRIGRTQIAVELTELDAQRSLGGAVDSVHYNDLQQTLCDWPVVRWASDYEGQHRQPTTDAQFWQNAAANVRRLLGFDRPAPTID